MRYTLLATAAVLALAGSAHAGSLNVNSNSNTNTNTNANSNSTTVGVATYAQTGPVSVNGGGNPHQPGGIAVPSPSAGYCGGISGGFAAGFASFSLGASIGTIELRCAQDRHISIGMSDPATRPEAEKLWHDMNAGLFDTPSDTKQTSQTTAPVTTEQVAQASADPVGSACNMNLPTVLLRQCLSKGQ